MSSIDIHHDPAGHRFVANVDGHAAHLDYLRDAGVLTITHTIVPVQIAGRGVAGRLVRAALDFAREQGLKVVPSCAYAEAWMRRHPDDADLGV